ncbi:IgGFc-binding protein-like [Emydura macquarii macquarii]|uniref:IgGFc-binding protein-like n=1 Tax=Emydura macquarii macquarii TaxID=1129001 RepID=UPI00352B819A
MAIPRMIKVLPSGERAKNDTQFGNTWISNTSHPGCTNDTSNLVPCPKLHMFQQLCGILTNRSGPFSECHWHESPAPYYESCIYDLCQYGRGNRMLCTAIESYDEMCTIVGVKMANWRPRMGCSFTCPAKNYFDFCGPACPATCANFSAPLLCTKPCVAGCFCREGYVLDAGVCVPMSQCGCTLNGQYHQLGEEVILTDACSRKCSCRQPAQPMECQDHACGALEICSVVNGTRGCNPVTFGTSWVFGFLHYTTFDGVTFDYQGVCKYTLSKYCGPAGNLPDFAVKVQNEHKGSIAVSWARLVELDVYGEHIAIAAGQYGRVQVNGSLVNLPVVLASGKLYAYFSGSSAVVQTDFGLSVSYDWSHSVSVSVSEIYFGSLCGLAGDFNGNRSDDFRTPNGSVVADAVTFGNSWKDADSSFHCTAVGLPAQCNKAELAQYRSQSYCGVIANTTGPFKECNKPAAAQVHVESCVRDLCATRGSHETLCQVLRSYARHCQSRGIAIEPWRQRAACALIAFSGALAAIALASAPIIHTSAPIARTAAPRKGCSYLSTTIVSTVRVQIVGLRGRLWYLEETQPGSLIVSTANEKERQGQQGPTPKAKEPQRLDLFGRKVYSTGGLQLRIANQQAILSRYNFNLGDTMAKFKDHLAAESKTEFGAMMEEGKARSQDIITGCPRCGRLCSKDYGSGAGHEKKFLAAGVRIILVYESE